MIDEMKAAQARVEAFNHESTIDGLKTTIARLRTINDLHEKLIRDFEDRIDSLEEGIESNTGKRSE